MGKYKVLKVLIIKTVVLNIPEGIFLKFNIDLYEYIVDNPLLS